MTGHVTFGGQCGECSSCGKCRKMLECNNIVIKEDSKETKTMEQDQSRKLYTFIIYSENVPGVLSQITAVYTRRQVNIESLNVCASSTPGAHKYTITAYCEESMAKMLTAQIEKKIDVLQANFFVDDDIYINETCLIKISSPIPRCVSGATSSASSPISPDVSISLFRRTSHQSSIASESRSRAPRPRSVTPSTTGPPVCTCHSSPDSSAASASTIPRNATTAAPTDSASPFIRVPC